jgi:hypothetical protein
MADHSIQKAHQCTSWLKTFTTKSRLTKHMATHSGNQHTCGICATMSATFKHALIRNMALHCVIQSRNCIHDLKRFADKHSLTTHNLPLKWLHTVLKVHTTVTCIKMVHRTTHLTVHSSTGQHRCEICDMFLTFTSNFTSLVWHTDSFILAYSFNHYSPCQLEVYHLLIFTSYDYMALLSGIYMYMYIENCTSYRHARF